MADTINLSPSDQIKQLRKKIDCLLKRILNPSGGINFIIPVNDMLVFKVALNIDNTKKEVGDFCMGIVEGQFINANYIGGDETLLASYGL